MDLNVLGKVAFVTGSSKGIGKQIAATLIEEGCKVILNGRDQDQLIKSAEELGVNFVLGDVSRASSAQAIVEQAFAIYHQLDILVCNVGSGCSVPPGDESEEEWQRMLEVNLMTATNAVNAVRPFLCLNGGVILCISSICGSAAIGAPIAYSASKAALNSFVRGSARYLAKQNIRINALAPGNIYFEGSTWQKKIDTDSDKVNTMLTNEVALGRFGTVHEVAAMAAFLCSDRAGFATGSIFVLDGGQLRG